MDEMRCHVWREDANADGKIAVWVSFRFRPLFMYWISSYSYIEEQFVFNEYFCLKTDQ